MARSIKFFYFGHQCPHNTYLLARIKTIAWRESVPLALYDLTEDGRPAQEFPVFSPTMLIVNDKYRWHGPFTKERIVGMLEDEGVAPESYSVTQSDNTVRGELLQMDPNTVLRTCDPCVGGGDINICRGKAGWVTGLLKETSLSNLGYIHLWNGKCVGGAEFLPSGRVPYPIPDKRSKNAFLTCSYTSDEKLDFKSFPLEKLIEDLRDSGFDTLSMAASKDVVFPNGPMSWYQKKGFVDKGLLVREELHNAEIHYMQKEL